MDPAEKTNDQSGPEPPPHIGPRQEETIKRERFEPHELAIVLSHYDLGVIEGIREYPRGSRRSPKVRISAESGEYLLKRRAPGRDQPYRVAFTHHLQLHLAEKKFPVPQLIGTIDENNSMLQVEDCVYELFQYVRGRHYDLSKRSAQFAGFTLARLHKLLADHKMKYQPPRGSYHGAAGIETKLNIVPEAVMGIEPEADGRALLKRCKFLRTAYLEAAGRVEACGYPAWKPTLVHGDWHPGNLLYNGDHRIIAVIDFDSARLEPRIADVANGALQLSMRITSVTDPGKWPDGLEANCLRAFLVGYDQEGANPLSPREYESVPWLIIEALITESVVPIAATGSFARISGAAFLEMIERKVRWIQPRAEKLVEFLRS